MFKADLSIIESVRNLSAAVEALNGIRNSNDHAAIVSAETKAKECATAANADIRAAVYSGLRDIPRAAVVKTAIDNGGTVPSVSVKRDKDGAYSVSVAPVPFDLYDMERRDKKVYAAAPGWSPSAVAVAYRVMRGVARAVAVDHAAAADNVTAIHITATTAAAVKDNDGALESNRALVDALQAVVDKIIFVARDGDGANVYRVRTQDARFFRECLIKEGKGLNGIAIATDSTVRRLVWKVVYNCVTGNGYTIDK